MPPTRAGTNFNDVYLNFNRAPLEMVLNYLSDAAGFIIVQDTHISSTASQVGIERRDTHPTRRQLAPVRRLGHVDLGPSDLGLTIGLHGQGHTLVHGETVIAEFLPGDVAIDLDGRFRQPIGEGDRAGSGAATSVRQRPSVGQRTNDLDPVPPAARYSFTNRCASSNTSAGTILPRI